MKLCCESNKTLKALNFSARLRDLTFQAQSMQYTVDIFVAKYYAHEEIFTIFVVVTVLDSTTDL